MPTLHAWCSIPARFIVPFVLLMACVQTSEAAEAVIAEAPIELDELQNAPTPAEALVAYEHELETLYQQYDAAVNLAAEAQGYTADEDYWEIVIDYTEALIEDVSMEL